MSESDDWDNYSSEIVEEIIVEDDKTVISDENKQVDKVEKEVAVDVEEMAAKLSGKAKKQFEKAMAKDNESKAFEGGDSSLRSPICCILGHVDTGKTKLLDKIRSSNVQNHEVGGITQQIGATFFPRKNLLDVARKAQPKLEIKVPGILIIDTPGHESFNNLRSRGSSLCDIAILVIDLMHGIEAQTRESIQLLKARKAPFIIALNKVDRIFQWNAKPWSAFKASFDSKTMKQSCRDEFAERWKFVQQQLWEESLDTDLFWNVKDFRTKIVVVPTSAHTGEGIPDLLAYIVGLTQKLMTKKITFDEKFQATVIERKNIVGFGTTIDAIIVNGRLSEGDTIMLSSMTGPVVTKIRSLLTPKPMSEIRVKGEYIHHKEIKAAMTVKLVCNGLDNIVAGTPMFRPAKKTGIEPTEEEIEEMMDEVQTDLAQIFKTVDTGGIGVYVQASTLGSLEALLQFLKDSKIPVFQVNLGKVSARDVKTSSSMRELGHPEYAVMLCFDVEISKEAENEAKKLDVKIFSADIIYHLQDQYKAYRDKQLEEEKEALKNKAIFPVVLEMLPNMIFNQKDPIVFGAKVKEGILKVGTPLIIPGKGNLNVGVVQSVEVNKKNVDQALKDTEAAVKISGGNVTYGRHFTIADGHMTSEITRESINLLKKFFRDEMTDEYWRLIIKLKKQQDLS